VLNWKLNGLLIKNWANSAFSGITHFFQGSTTANPLTTVHNSNDITGPEPGYSQEWVLEQGVSDIVIRDIEVSLGWIFPQFIRDIYHRAVRKIILYFYLDEMDEEFDNELRKNLWKRLNLSSFKPKLIQLQTSINQHSFLKMISFRKSYRLLIARLKRIMAERKPENLLYSCTSNMRTDHSNENNNNNEKIRGPDRAKLKSAFPFHKRN
jgi:hypothetical protein